MTSPRWGGRSSIQFALLLIGVAAATAFACGGRVEREGAFSSRDAGTGRDARSPDAVSTCVNGCCPPVDYTHFDPGPPVSFADDVVPIFRRTCNFASCHLSDRPRVEADLALGPRLRNLEDGGFLPPPDPVALIAIHRDLVGTPSLIAPSMLRVAPGDPEQSFLMHKLDGTHDSCGIECTWINPDTNQPSCGESQPYSADLLGLESRNLIRRWIAQGAQLGFGCDQSSPVRCQDVGGVCCGSRCTVLSSKRDCGSCGNTCTAEEMKCVEGACGCPYDRPVDCNGSCLAVHSDRENCGGCGVRCGPGENCSNGRCVCESPECLPAVVCGGTPCAHPSPANGLHACCTAQGACGVDMATVQMQPRPVPRCDPVPAPGTVPSSCPDQVVEIGSFRRQQRGCCSRGTCGVMLEGPDFAVGCIAIDARARCEREVPDAGATDAGAADASAMDASTTDAAADQRSELAAF